ncbi:MAG: hypothetical protein ACOVNQ_01520, partial [Pirellula sp.]
MLPSRILFTSGVVYWPVGLIWQFEHYNGLGSLQWHIDLSLGWLVLAGLAMSNRHQTFQYLQARLEIGLML